MCVEEKGEHVNVVTPLVALAEKIAVSDGFHYRQTEPEQAQLPHSVRVFARRRPASLLGKALHNQHTMVVPLKNTAAAIVEREFLKLSPGKALLVFPRQVHYYMNQGAGDGSVFWLFCGFLMKDNARYASLRNTPVDLDENSAADVQALLRLTYRPNYASDPEADRLVALRVAAILEQLLYRQKQTRERPEGLLTIERRRISAGNTPTGGAATTPLLREACRMLGERLDRPVELEEIAGLLHVSPGHLRNEFHRRIGCGFGQYARYLKMHQACMLLDTTDLPLADIGLRCGYGSIYAFSRAFKKNTGVAPGAYRRTCAGGK